MRELKCPKCNVGFFTESVAGITIQTCRQCSAVFIDGVEIFRLREGPVDVDPKKLEIKNIKDTNFIAEKCPRCEQKFHSEEYIKDSDIHFKLCTKCSSIMFDQSDLAKLKNFQISPMMKVYDEFEDLFPVMKRVICK
ncbi:MAG TPA: zf-TFIIB domain-containing protein [Candidatus Wallbacteria bacterium]|nr:zf-TFIIB domain-containing protein [Candidatus Wallbacteria bacterium]